MYSADASLWRTGVNYTTVGSVMDPFNSIKWTAIITFVRKIIIPAAIGGLVVWLISHDLEPWAVVACGVVDALAIAVKECV